jgi:hypothetical protein
MLSIPTGDPDPSLLGDAKYSKRWKETILNIYLRENPHTDHLTGINYLIWWTSVLQKIFPKISL